MREFSGKEAVAARLPAATGRLWKEKDQSVAGYVAIKGTRNGLLLTLEPETPFNEVLRVLAERLAESPSFFQGAALTIDNRQRVLQSSEQMQLEGLLSQYHMSVATLDMAIPTEKLKGSKTVTLSPHEPTFEETFGKKHMEHDPRESEDTLFLRRTVRSGQAIHHKSNVVVLGDVNPGAEIVAGGDIVVWGVLRGMVHAGYPDNEDALVCSLQLSPVQLRIAHLLSRPPEGFEAQPRPEVATIRQGQIVVETWVSGRPPRK
jgi:septum site-determining protein MinC